MFGALDYTYCCSTNCQNKCGRKLSQEDYDKIKAWWGGDGFLLSMANFCKEDGSYEEII